MKVTVKVQQDHLRRLTQRASPIDAAAEMIWNALDADANTVDVFVDENDLGGIECVRFVDNGSGIPHSVATQAFGSLGDSWKKRRRTSDAGRHLHGEKGEGRYTAFAIGNHIRWKTVWWDAGTKKFRGYEIKATDLDLRTFDVGEPKELEGRGAGTEVVVSNVTKVPKSLLADDAPLRLAKVFAVYLRRYPGIRIQLDGRLVEPGEVQGHVEDYPIEGVTDDDGQPISAELTIIEWKHSVDREIVLCDRQGCALAPPRKAGIQAKGFVFSAYLKSDFLRAHQANLALDEMLPDIQRLVNKAKDVMRGHFRKRGAEQVRSLVEEWKEEKVYPYEGPPANAVEEVERQVFDVVALNVNEYLPDFPATDPRSKRFSFRMLRSAIEKSPKEVRRIIEEVLELPQAKKEELLELLEKTSLAAVVSAAKLVVDRLDFLAGLETLLFSRRTKKSLKERTELHRILAENTWIFGEQYHLTVDDKGLTEALDRHLKILGKERASQAPVVTEAGTPGIVDLMLSRRIPLPNPQELEHLVVELKRPSVKIDEGVLSQLQKYAWAVAEDDRFEHTTTKWTFVAISNELSKGVRRAHFRQRDRKDGLVVNSDDPPMQIWVMTWGQLIQEAKARHEFIQKELAYRAGSDEGLAYLKKVHGSYLPEGVKVNGADAPAEHLPLRQVPPEEAKQFENCVPALDLQVAAGGWSADQVVGDEAGHYDWVSFTGRTKPGKDIFVAQVVGESMNRRIPNGAWCVWRLNPGCDGLSGTEVVLAQHRDIQDAETGFRYTVKLYKREVDGETAEAVRVVLSPASTDPSFKPIVLEGLAEGELEIVAALVEVLG